VRGELEQKGDCFRVGGASRGAVGGKKVGDGKVGGQESVGRRFLCTRESRGRKSRPGPREDATWCAVTNCDILWKVGSLGWAWVNWEGASHAK